MTVMNTITSMMVENQTYVQTETYISTATATETQQVLETGLSDCLGKVVIFLLGAWNASLHPCHSAILSGP